MRPALRVVPHDDAPPEREVAPLDQLFRRYAPYAAAIATRILGRPEDVDDVIQDVFLDAIGGLRKLEDPSAVKTWIATLTVRKCMRKLRRRHVRAWLGFDEAPDYAQTASPEASPEQRAHVTRVYAALDRLPADERVPWVLRHVEGLDLQSIAETTGRSLATVKRKLVAAQTKLKLEMGDE